MNKVILSLLLAVCILGMALIMLNERLRKPEPATAPAGIIAPVTPPTAAEGTPPAEPAGDALRMPPQGQGKLPDLNANGESPARAPLPSLKPEEKSAPASNALASSAPSSPQPAVAKPAVPAKPAAPMTHAAAQHDFQRALRRPAHSGLARFEGQRPRRRSLTQPVKQGQTQTQRRAGARYGKAAHIGGKGRGLQGITRRSSGPQCRLSGILPGPRHQRSPRHGRPAFCLG